MTISELTSLISAVTGLAFALRGFVQAILALLPRRWFRHRTGP